LHEAAFLHLKVEGLGGYCSDVAGRCCYFPLLLGFSLDLAELFRDVED